MNQADAFAIVCMHGDRLVRERTGWRDVKAMIVLVAHSGDWNGASCLADALGVSPDAQQAIYYEVYGHHPPFQLHTNRESEPGPPREATA